MIVTENIRGKSGVYCAIHRDSLACYVGSSVNLSRRRHNHLNEARKGRDVKFHKALAELGAQSFDFEVIEFCPREKLAEREDFWIKFYRSAYGNNFNTLKTAQWPVFEKPTDEIRQKLRRAALGRKFSDAHRKALSDSHTGIKHTAQSRANMAASHIGVKRSDEARARMSLAQKGRTVSSECRAKLRAINLGKKHSEESKLKLSATLRGRPQNPNSAAALLKANTGSKRSLEARAKMRTSRIAYVERMKAERTIV